MIRYCILLILSASLAACAGDQQVRVVTKEVKVAVPVPCAPNVAQPDGHLARSRAELATMLDAAPNVTERARIVSDQLLLWLGYGPQLEAAAEGCKGNP